MLNCILVELLACFAIVVAAPVVIAQVDHSGFINIDCGLSGENYYIDETTGINYTSDAGFIDSGVNVKLSQSIGNYKQYWSVRSFPEGNRNCYSLRPEKAKHNTYLITAWFLYGNYDGKYERQEFDLYIGENFWETVRLEGADEDWSSEIIHTPTTDYIHVCLHKTGETVPFISELDLRPLNNPLYKTQFGALYLHQRYDLGSVSGEDVRYPDDVYDRYWYVAGADKFLPNITPLSTNLTVGEGAFRLPSAVMSTAATPENSSGPLYMSWQPQNSSVPLLLYLHFAEIEKLQDYDSREFQIYLNGDPWEGKCYAVKGECSPKTNYLESYTLSSISPEPGLTKYELSINSTQRSTKPPIINAIEIFMVKNFTNSGTDDTDVAAMFGIKSYYGLTRNWQGDPCRPQAFTWKGVGCNYDHNSSIIVSLNLSSSGLNGSITPHIANLTSIQALDLSNNNLSGGVPEFLAQLASLKTLNLLGNNFSGSIPVGLLEKSKQGLSFSIGGLSNNANTNVGKRKKVIVPIVASALAAFLIVLFVFITIYSIRRRRKADVDLNKNNVTLHNKSWQITYSEVLKITNNFNRVLGKGGFGTVYYGIKGEKEVAVKMLNPSSAQGHKEFQTEANLLMTIHHKNLTSLVGYCNKGTKIGIIYEYMVNGNLQQHLSELSWEQRLRIAIDAAQGLEYLHHGCKPPIIHRDIKPTNILLDEKFQAKLSDFGLSRVFASESVTHVSINTIAGSPGYMDPECYSSFKLTEKNDIYSFGVVLLEIITGRRVVDINSENKHITEWVVPFLENGDIRTIVDQRFEDNVNINSAWKAVELAMRCVSQSYTTRPTMSDVVIELKNCLALETSNLETEANSLTGAVLESEYIPQER